MTSKDCETRTITSMPRPIDREEISVHSRVTALETGMESLTRDVKSLTDTMREQSNHMSESLEKAVKEFRDGLNALASEVVKAKSPNIPLWLSLGAFAFTLVTATMGIFLAPLYMNQGYYSKDLAKHSEYVREKIDSMDDNIKERTQQVSTNTRSLEKLAQMIHQLDVKLAYEKEISTLRFTQQERNLDIVLAKQFPEFPNLKQTLVPPGSQNVPPSPPLDLK